MTKTKRRNASQKLNPESCGQTMKVNHTKSASGDIPPPITAHLRTSRAELVKEAFLVPKILILAGQLFVLNPGLRKCADRYVQFL
jgi:hypothetical protein